MCAFVGFGDIVSQKFEGREGKKNISELWRELLKQLATEYNPKRTLRMVTAAGILAIPLHYYFITLEKYIPQTPSAPFKKLAIDQLLYAPISLAGFCLDLMDSLLILEPFFIWGRFFVSGWRTWEAWTKHCGFSQAQTADQLFHRWKGKKNTSSSSCTKPLKFQSSNQIIWFGLLPILSTFDMSLLITKFFIFLELVFFGEWYCLGQQINQPQKWFQIPNIDFKFFINRKNFFAKF